MYAKKHTYFIGSTKMTTRNTVYYKEIDLSFLFSSGGGRGASFCTSFCSLLCRAGRGTHIIGHFARLKSEGVIFETLYPREETEQEDGPSEKVEDAVKNHFAG